MSVDIYVMPLTLYKCGDFESPLQRIFGPENVMRVTPQGIVDRQTPSPDTISAAFARTIAHDALAQVIDAVRSANPDAEIAWEDVGQQGFAEQAFHTKAAQTYARWLSYREESPDFEVPESGEFVDHPVWQKKSQRLRYPQISLHDCFCGYFLPCEFSSMIEIEAFRAGNSCATQCIGSSFRLKAELLEIGETLGMRWQANEGLIGNTDDSDVKYPEAVVESVAQLSRAAETSCVHHLPIIFDG